MLLLEDIVVDACIDFSSFERNSLGLVQSIGSVDNLILVAIGRNSEKMPGTNLATTLSGFSHKTRSPLPVTSCTN